MVFDEFGPVRMIRSKDWKYVHRYPYGPNELYDLSNDPSESVNLINDSSKAQISQEMKSQLDAWFLKYVDPDLDGSKQAVYGKGQIDMVGLSGHGRKAFIDEWRYLVDHDNDEFENFSM